MKALIILERTSIDIYGIRLMQVLVHQFYGYGTVDVLDITDPVNAEEDDLGISTLEDDTYDIIYDFTSENLYERDLYAMLILKLKASVLATITPVSSGTCQANVEVDEVILAATEDEEDDYYNNMYIITSGTTEIQRIITDYVGDTDTCTIEAIIPAITSTETYKIYSQESLQDVIFELNLAEGEGEKDYTAKDLFRQLYPNCNVPLIVEYANLIEDTMPDDEMFPAELFVEDGVCTFDTDGYLTEGRFGPGDYVFIYFGENLIGSGFIYTIDYIEDGIIYLKEQFVSMYNGEVSLIAVGKNRLHLMGPVGVLFGLDMLLQDMSIPANYHFIMQILNKGKDISQTDVQLDQDLDALEEFVEDGVKAFRVFGIMMGETGPGPPIE